MNRKKATNLILLLAAAFACSCMAYLVASIVYWQYLNQYTSKISYAKLTELHKQRLAKWDKYFWPTYHITSINPEFYNTYIHILEKFGGEMTYIGDDFEAMALTSSLNATIIKIESINNAKLIDVLEYLKHLHGSSIEASAVNATPEFRYNFESSKLENIIVTIKLDIETPVSLHEILRELSRQNQLKYEIANGIINFY